MLTAERLRKLLHYDAETGVFTRLVDSGPARVGDIAGSLMRNGYIRISADGKQYYAHRLAWLHVHDEWPAAGIDHLNGHKTDNRISNLRDVSQVVNGQNQRKAHKRNRGGLLGASFDKGTGRWAAQISHGGRNRYIGRFESADSAHRAYLQVKRVLHAGCAI